MDFGCLQYDHLGKGFLLDVQVLLLIPHKKTFHDPSWKTQIKGRALIVDDVNATVVTLVAFEVGYL